MPPSASSSARPQEQNYEDYTIKFTNTKNLFDILNLHSFNGDIVIVTHVSPKDFVAIDRQRTIQRRKFRWRRYDSESQILTIITPNRAHETLHIKLYYSFLFTVSMDIWDSRGATTQYTGQIEEGADQYDNIKPSERIGDVGEADSAGGPYPTRIKGEDWPTLVVLAGESQSLDQLHMDMEWWFTASKHDVKMVVLAKLDKRQSIIILEKWEEEAAVAARPGATTTGRSAALHRVLRQTITIHRDETTNPVSYNVVGGALTFDFRLLFLRDPSP